MFVLSWTALEMFHSVALKLHVFEKKVVNLASSACGGVSFDFKRCPNNG